MALSTTRTLLTQTGINTHQVFDIGGLDSVGVATFSNFKTGLSNLHSTGLTVGDTFLHSTGVNLGAGATVSNNGNATFSGIITATSFVGDISQATGAAAGLGTALSQTQTDPLNKVYYTNKVLSISTTTTIDHPATANLAYTQYGDIKIEDGHDLVIKTDDDFKYDILGISTTKLADNYFQNGLTIGIGSSVKGNLIGNVTGNVTGNINNSSNLLLQTDGSERLRIDSSGRLLIGTTDRGQDDADNLTIDGSGEGTGRTGITIRSANNTFGSIFFSDATSGTAQYDGVIAYQHDIQQMRFSTAETQRMFIDATGKVTKPFQPFFKAQPSTAQNITSGSNTVVNYQSEIHDVGGIYNASISTFTAPIGGIYLITWNYFCIPTDKIARANLHKSTNGGSSFAFLHRGDRVGKQGDVYEATSNIAMVELNANDQLRIQHEEGDLHVNTGYNYFQGYLLG